MSNINKSCECTTAPFQGTMYIKESLNYFCKSCGDLTKIGITRNPKARDLVYKKTEMPHEIVSSALFGVKKWNLEEFDDWMKHFLKSNGKHCTHSDSTEFFSKAGAEILVNLLSIHSNIEPLFMDEHYKNFYVYISEEDNMDYQMRFNY